MRNFARASAEWLRRLFVGEPERAAPRPGERSLASLSQALAVTEALVSEAVCHLPGAPATATEWRRQTQRGSAPLNAFGRPLMELDATGPSGAIAAATGMALTGLRSAVFLPGEHVADVSGLLADAATRQVPLVIHTGLEGHDAYLAARGAGMQLLASNAQEALDLLLVARRVSEQALVPGLLAHDEEQVGGLVIPDASLIREYLGPPGGQVAPSTTAQRILFGETRRRMPRWFDPAHPVALATQLSGRALALSQRGREVLVEDQVACLAREAMRALTALTGRPLGFVREFGTQDAKTILVTQGAAFETAAAVARELRRTGGSPAGVLGISWLRPFPREEIAQALGKAEVVTVFERTAAAPSLDAPLLREVRSRFPHGAGPRWISAGAGSEPLSAAQARALFENMSAGDCARGEVRLDADAAGTKSSFPRRELLLQPVQAAHPRLNDEGLVPSAALDLRPEGARTVALVGPADRVAPDVIASLAKLLQTKACPHPWGSARIVAPGVRAGRLCVAPTPEAERAAVSPQAGPVDALLLLHPLPSDGFDPFVDLVAGGAIVVASPWDAAETWRRFPPRWRARVRELSPRMALTAPHLAELLATGPDLLGEVLPGTPLPWETFGADSDAADSSSELPQLVKRLAHVRATHDCVSRYWGEVVEPTRVEGDTAADPFLVARTVPACTTAFRDASRVREALPRLDPTACVGCGRCWTACPDSAIGVSVHGVQVLLDAAADAASKEAASRAISEEDQQAAAATDQHRASLRRSHKHLAGHISSRLAKGEELSAELLDASCAWLVERMAPPEDERVGYADAFQGTRDQFTRLPSVVCDPFFNAPEGQKKGDGQLLQLAIDPRACQGCGVCVAVCPEAALSSAPQTPEAVAALRSGRQSWELLPDTAGATIARAAELAEVGPLPALLLSRHCAEALVGGGGSQPGSGQRLAARLVTAVTEHHVQRRVATWARELSSQAGALRERAASLLTASLTATDPGALDEALGELGGGRVELAAVTRRLEELGERVNLDRDGAHRLVRATQDVERLRWLLTEGESGLGRARFGLVATQGVANWAARWPDNPFYAPVAVELSEHGVELARGTAEGMLAEYTELARVARRAKLLLAAPSDLPAQLEACERLTWRDLSAAEREACPPLLLLGDDKALGWQGLGALSHLLTSDVPVKVILLDGLTTLASNSPVLAAMAHRRAFVLSSSVAHPTHLAQGLERALSFPGPALIHLHAPSPRRHGFAPGALLERARLAVTSRMHPLFLYDPGGDGLFGTRASLDGNPAPREVWSALEDQGGDDASPFTPAHWALGEERFANQFRAPGQSTTDLVEFLRLDPSKRARSVPCVTTAAGEQRAVSDLLLRACEERLHTWTVLQELTGAQSPFTDRIRAELRAEIEATFADELEAAKADGEAKLAEVRANQDQELAARLRERLLALAGQRRP